MNTDVVLVLYSPCKYTEEHSIVIGRGEIGYGGKRGLELVEGEIGVSGKIRGLELVEGKLRGVWGK